jgi:hypothetical protein
MGIGVADIAEGWAEASPSGDAPHSVLADVACASDLLIDVLQGVDEATDLAVLEDVVALVRRRIDAAEGELARLTAALQDVSQRPETGARSLTQFVARRSGCAQRRVAASLHLGRELAECPQIAAALRSGSISVDNARLLLEVAGLAAFAERETELLAAAARLTPGRLRHVIERWLATIPAEPDPPAPESDPESGSASESESAPQPDCGETELEKRRRLAYERRAVRAVPIGHGLTRLDITLPTELAHVVMNRLAEIAGLSGDDRTGRSWPQRLADALVEMASVDGSAWALIHGVSPQQTSRPTVVGIAPDDVIAGRRYGGGVSAQGDVLDRTQLAEMTCTADRLQMTHDARGAPIDVTGRHRIYYEKQYLSMVERDGGCRVGGCEQPASRCQTHHVDEHISGGRTVVHRGVLVCDTHHRWLHRSGARFVGDPAGALYVETADGRVHRANPPMGHIPPGDEQPRRRGIAIMFDVA